MGRDGKEQVARQMALSEHTAGDHDEALHKHFGVNSRAELLGADAGTDPGGGTAVTPP